MSVTHGKMHIAALAASTALVGTATAGTIDSSSFNGVTNAAVSTAGTLGWGYIDTAGNFFNTTYNDTPYGDIPQATASGTSVTLTEGTAGTDTVGAQGNTPLYTFDGTQAYGSYGNFAPDEQDIWTLKLNDLGIGTFTITLYMGHSSTNRVFDMDVNLTDSGGNDSTTTVSPQISTLGSTVAAYGTSGLSYTYDVTVTTTAADADLSLVFGGISGGFGGAIFSGYTVSGTVIPEPSSLALLGLGGLMMARRRSNAS
ncbi:MAG: PEP-CTERM sorting domain-containing protein [Phycisphaeraceae bacterium]